METKVIIHGGWADKPNAYNSEFFKQILKDTSGEVKILLILFAKEEEEEQERFSGTIKARFEEVKSNRNIEYKIATHDKFESQVKEADIIYLRGGNTLMLLGAMKKHPDFNDSVRGKIVAGESAGTYFLSKCFYSKTIGKILGGSDLLPIKVICHFEGKNEEKLDKCQVNLEKVLLKDFEHKIFRI